MKPLWENWRSLERMAKRIPIRWRLALVSLGLFVLLVSASGLLLSIATEQALLSNTEASLCDEARIALKGLSHHPLTLAQAPGPAAGPLPVNFRLLAIPLLDRLSSLSTTVVILSPEGSILLSGSITPPPILLSPERVRQALDEPEDYLLVKDTQGQRQLVVVLPLVSSHRTVALLQVGMQITHIDEFLMTFRMLLFIACFGALGFAIALTFPLVGAALRPLVDIEWTSRQIASGELSMRIEPPLTSDEIGRLAISFNQMVSKLEESLLRQKRFVADVSHELRTPLAALSGSLEMLLIGADQGDREAMHRLARVMYAEVQRMHRLVEDLLALTRLDEGKIKLRKEAILVQAVLEQVCHQAQQLAHGQHIRCQVAPGTPLVCADRDKLQQILLNLIDNALKFTPSDGLIELEGSSEGRQTVVITVRDTGQGISPEALPHVFDRFYRADPSRSRQLQHRSGNGLGLAIAKELLEAQKGTIQITSTLGKGTTITMRLRSAESSVLPQSSEIRQC